MNENIPKIHFSKQNITEIEFEIFTLSSLFARQDKIAQQLDKPHSAGFYHIIYISLREQVYITSISNRINTLRAV